MLYAENGMFDQEDQSYHLQINTTLLKLLDHELFTDLAITEIT
jgi:hypothetical protein